MRGALLGGAGIAVSAHTRHPEQAIAYAFWLDCADVQEGVYYDAGGQPGNAVAWESDRTNADSLDFFRGTRATLEGAYVRPRFVHYIELQNALSEFVTEALRRPAHRRPAARHDSTKASRNGWCRHEDDRSLVRGHRGR